MMKYSMNMTSSIVKAIRSYLLGMVLIMLATGCTSTRIALPPDLYSSAKVAQMTGIRTYAYEHSSIFQKDLIYSVKQEIQRSSGGHDDEGNYFINILSLSGGGPQGAFGAGILCGWSKAGNRPTFKIVTGISTGALIAPFAFLGPEYDKTIQQVYTTISTRDVLRMRPRLIIHRGIDSLVDSSPLENLISEYIDKDVIQNVARAHAQGRRLFIGTTDMDANRLVIWNMGAVAAANNPKSNELFRKVLLASASIPIFFPPVYIPVEADGNTYEEMHVDGGVSAQAFLYGDIFNLNEVAHGAGLSSVGLGRIYIIKNMQSLPSYEQVKSELIPIAEKTILSLLANQGTGDLYRIYTIAQREGMEFNLVYIPSTFKFKGKELFDTEEMKQLFELGFNMGKSGDFWHKYPPGYVD
jgi:hypothetical protein